MTSKNGDNEILEDAEQAEAPKRKSNAVRLSIASVIEAIDRMQGNISAAAKALNVRRASLYRFINRSEKLKDALKDARETFIDNVESALYRNALNDNVAAQIFIMKTLGKDRGYIERQEVEHSGLIDVANLSDEELAARKAALLARGSGTRTDSD